jgi:RNA recognition motif-containing protein
MPTAESDETARGQRPPRPIPVPAFALFREQQMAVNALVNAERPIIMIYDPDQGRAEEYAEIEFKTQADANAAVTQLNAIFKTATRITFKQQQSNP